MSSTDVSSDASTQAAEVGTIDMGLEVVTVPVSDVDRAKRFYQSLGWRLDIDLVISDEVRNVQMTPSHSQCSIHFGKGMTAMEPGCLDRLYLTVEDIDAAREDLISRGVDVSEVEEQQPPPGFDLPGRSYFAYASFADPDGNGWLLQEVKTRLPGRVTSATYDSVSDLAQALVRAEAAHGKHEQMTGERDAEWPSWYAQYMTNEQTGEELPT